MSRRYPFRGTGGGGGGGNGGSVLPLHISGKWANQFITALDAFDFLHAWLEGERGECENYVDVANGLGTQELRAFGQWAITDFQPNRYGAGFYQGVKDAANFLNDKGQRIAIDVLTSVKELGVQANIYRLADTLGDLPNVRLRLGNEYEQNGYDPKDFAQPSSPLYIGNGSGLGDEPPPAPEWETFCIHTPRDGDDHLPLWVKSSKAIHEAYVGDFGPQWINEHPQYRGYRFTTAGEVDEPIACGDQDEPGRTSSNPYWFWQLTALLKLAGGFSICAHWRPKNPRGVQEVPQGRTAECIQAMVAAGRLPLGKCIDGQWRHTGPDMSIYSTDRFIEGAPENPKGTMDSYEQQLGNRVEHIALVAGPEFTPDTQHGAEIDEAYSYAGEMPTVFVLRR